MERRTLLAIALSILIILLYQSFFFKPQPIENKEVIKPKQEKIIELKKPLPKAKEKFSEIENENLKLKITENGAAISEILLKKYDARLPVGGGTMGDWGKPFETQRINGGIRCIYRDEKMEMIKEYLLPPEGYLIKLRLSMRNLMDAPWEGTYKMLLASIPEKRRSFESRFEEIAFSFKDRFQHRNLSRIREKGMRWEEGFDWMGWKGRYFSLILKPLEGGVEGFAYRSVQGFQIGIETGSLRLLPQTSLTHKYLLYAGPNDLKELAKYEFGFEKVVTFGIFGGIARILLGILEFFHALTHNWGLATILLSLLISLILYPFTYKSMLSMAKLQRLQPQMERLRTEYKDNSQKMNRAIMELYKKEKINPLGGCLPLFFQMPIFIALYQALIRSVKLKGAKFLWIKDLSSPDKAFTLPFSLPFLGKEINLLPILMMGAMFLQQRLSTGRKAPLQQSQQKMMGIFMPLIFGFIFYNFPSGLVLYWLTNTLLMILCQFHLSKIVVTE